MNTEVAEVSLPIQEACSRVLSEVMLTSGCHSQVSICVSISLTCQTAEIYAHENR